jgi:hypothetical protein
MNYGSPLSKDHRAKKDEEKPKKEKSISLGTTKRILKKTNYPIGINEMIWLNSYIENRMRGECLPITLLSNDIQVELFRLYGKEGAEKFEKKIITDFCQQHGLPSIPD